MGDILITTSGTTSSTGPVKRHSAGSIQPSPSQSPLHEEQAAQATRETRSGSGNNKAGSPVKRGRPSALAFKVPAPDASKIIVKTSSMQYGLDAELGATAISVPETPYVEDSLWGRMYLPLEPGFHWRPVLTFIFCPLFYGRMASRSKAWLYLRGLLSISTLSVVVQIVILALGMAVGIAPLTANNTVGPSSKTLLILGASDSGLLVRHQEWWRLLSSLFLVSGVAEAIPLALILLRVGSLLEFRWGHMYFFMAYFIPGAIGVTTAALLYPVDINVGAATSLAGLLGAWIVELLTPVPDTDPTPPMSSTQLSIELLMWAVSVLVVLVLAGTASHHEIVSTVIAILAGAIVGSLGFPGGESGAAASYPRSCDRNLVVRTLGTVVLLAGIGAIFVMLLVFAKVPYPSQGEQLLY